MLIIFIRDFDAPLTGGGFRRIAAGTEIDLEQTKAGALIAAGIAEELGPPPYFDPDGGLVVPTNTPPRFRYWQDGQTLSETLRELFEERAAIIEFEGGLPRHEAERRAAELAVYRCNDNQTEAQTNERSCSDDKKGRK